MVRSGGTLMAENRFSQLDYRVPLPQAEVNRIGPGWADQSRRADRVDPVLHLHPLPSPPPPVVPLRPVPSPNELRGALAQALASMRSTTETLADAEATVTRAAAHVAACRMRLAEFDGLDDEATRATIETLRSGSGRIDQDDETIRRKRNERAVARDDLVAAEAAQKVLAGDVSFARSNAEAATQAAHRAAVAVLGCEASAMAERHDALLAEVATIREGLARFDRCATASGGTLPPSVLAVLRDPRNGIDYARNVGKGEWQAKLNALMEE